MRKSSYAFIGLVLVLFGGLQGWFLTQMFLQPRVFHASEAVITGETTDVRSPMQGFVKKGEYVQSNELLASIIDNSPDSLSVKAKLLVPPKYAPRIEKLLTAFFLQPFPSHP